MWVNLTGDEGPETQKESIYYRGKGAYVGAGILWIPGQRVGWADVTMVLGLPLYAKPTGGGSPEFPVGSSGFQWVQGAWQPP